MWRQQVVWCALILCGTTLRAPADVPARQAITAKYAAVQKAGTRGFDAVVAWYEANLAPGFEFVVADGNGRMTIPRESYLGLMKSVAQSGGPAFRGFKPAPIRIEQFTMSGAEVVTLVRDRNTTFFRDLQGRYGPRGSDHAMTAILTLRHTWTRVNGDWKIRVCEQLSVTRLLDGKPYRSPRGGAANRGG